MLKHIVMGLRGFFLFAAKVWSFICYCIRRQLRSVSEFLFTNKRDFFVCTSLYMLPISDDPHEAVQKTSFSVQVERNVASEPGDLAAEQKSSICTSCLLLLLQGLV